VRVLVIGGGPAGLFFSILAKRALPDADVHVVEQNRHDATYGWGVVFTEGAIDALSPSAPDVVGAIAHDRPPTDHLDVIVGENRRSVHGNTFFRIGRVGLLELLQGFAREAGVTCEFEKRVEDERDLAGWDLVVGADGVNSVVRDLFADEFRPEVSLGRNWWAWYGTRRLFPAVSLIFEPRPEGMFVGHAYQYAADMSGFVVEVTPAAFEAAGLAELTGPDARSASAEIFARHLGGEELLDNRSVWFQPKFVSCANWSTRNVVLIGDALHTVHPSIGSGTRFAMRDAVALSDALVERGEDIPAVLTRFERMRRRRADAFQAAARRSIAWYESLSERTISDTTRFALEYIMRTGRVRFEEFRRLNPDIVAEYERPSAGRDSLRSGVSV
jgi:2-polyprenyl-6-methoxyphenol hydroxylase-like FAD-dependent oxidoreductase